jgi:predicted alpha/beta-fold hydrolase
MSTRQFLPVAGLPPFLARRGAGHPDFQTLAVELWPRPSRRQTEWWRRRERVELPLPDGDHLLGWLHRQPGRSPDEAPLVIHAHGLGSHADAPLMQGVSFKAHAAGFHTLRLNWRGAGGSENLGTRFTTGMGHADVTAVVAACRRLGFERIYWSGVSLGASILLNALSRGEDLPGVRGAVVFSSPLAFGAVSRSLATRRNVVYDTWFVWRLKALLRRYVRQGKGGERYRSVLGELRRVRTVFDFDDRITAPVSGFETADDYYRAASPGPHLAAIRVPTRLVLAADDPFVPLTDQLPYLEALPEDHPLSWTITSRGGHVAFLGARPDEALPWEDAWWAENLVVRAVLAWEAGDGSGAPREP